MIGLNVDCLDNRVVRGDVEYYWRWPMVRDASVPRGGAPRHRRRLIPRNHELYRCWDCGAWWWDSTKSWRSTGMFLSRCPECGKLITSLSFGEANSDVLDALDAR